MCTNRPLFTLLVVIIVIRPLLYPIYHINDVTGGKRDVVEMFVRLFSARVSVIIVIYSYVSYL